MRKLGAAGIALVGLWSLTYVPSLLAYPISFASFGTADLPPGLVVTAMTLSIVPALGTLALGLFLIIKREQLAERWFPDETLDVRLDGLVLLRVGMILIGVGLVIEAFISILRAPAGALGDALQIMMTGGDWYLWESPSLAYSLSDLALTLVQLALGCVLVVRAQPIAARLWLGKAAPEPPAAPPSPYSCPTCGAPYDPNDYVGGDAEARCTECGATLELPPHA